MTGSVPPPLDREHRTLHRLLRQAAAWWGDDPALQQPDGGGAYTTYSWNEYLRAAEEVAAGLRASGLQLGDIIALASETRAEFYLADLGIMVAGGVAAALYTSLATADQVKLLRNCEPKFVFAESPGAMQALLAAGAADVPARWILLTGESGDTLTLARLREVGRGAIAAEPGLIERLSAEVRPEHYAILYLTSGATGESKMGLVTHNSIVANSDAGPPALPVGPGDSTLAFLPSAHITQRLVVELLPIRMGYTVWFSEGLLRLPKELQSIRPTFFVAPPRVWERIYTSVATEIKKKPLAVRRLFYLAIGAGNEAARRRERRQPLAPWMNTTLRIFDRLVYAKIRERLGGRVKVAAAGSAPLGRDLAEFYTSIGFPLLEGYGLTEGGVVCLNPVGRPKAGSIGKPLYGAEMKVAGDGELLLRGEMVFSGYYRDPEASAQVLRDGWLHTGDLAEIDAEGYIYITGRKKEVIVASNGKKIFPSRIEALLKLEPIINHVLLAGDRQPYVTALLTLNPAVVDAIPAAQGKPLAEQVRLPAVVTAVKRVVAQVNKQLAPFEQIRKFRLIERDFSIEAGELTPTLKVRRARVMENFRKELAELYAGHEGL